MATPSTLDTPSTPPTADLADADPRETREWLDSLAAVIAHEGPGRARHLLDALLAEAGRARIALDAVRQTPYVNTIPVSEQPPYPGDLAIEARIEALLRWNAAVMVSRGNARNPGLGGHISTYASTARLFEVALGHVLRGHADDAGDQVYFQAHASPGLYARAWLEGRLTEADLERFRRETGPGRGLSSYPHPRLMPDFWELPTASMGLTAIAAIYQARFNRYLHHRGISDTRRSRVWAFLGDGEMDEPESTGAIALAAREQLDNLIFVVNCNLQRLDGPVRGNGQIIQELEGLFGGAGWTVIKVLWGSGWDDLLADDDGALVERLGATCDGDWQRWSTVGGDEIRRGLFDTPALRARVAHLDDDAIAALAHEHRGGLDPIKIHAAYAAAVENTRGPTVVLAHTIKGYGMGPGIQGANATHGRKTLETDDLRWLRDRLQLPISDRELDDPPLYRPADDSPERVYLTERRAALGGPLPARQVRANAVPYPPPEELIEPFRGGSGQRAVSTTAAFAQLLARLMKQPGLGERIVPIIADEARTFGMEALFGTHGIYSPHGQRYEPTDSGTLLAYKEQTDGQVLQEGMCEAGSMASFWAAGTAYATHGEPMLPFYIFYSVFGFQRVGDQIWAFGDLRGRGFLLGATAGRTTLNGEGLQHQDGHSLLVASTVPNLEAYDPAFAYEVAVIIAEGIRRMIGEAEDVFYYLTLYNENLLMPPMPEGVGAGVIEGLYRVRDAPAGRTPRARILASGSIMLQALHARDLLAEQFNVRCEIWSATSYQRLRREALAVERWNRLHPDADPRIPRVTELLGETGGPVIAVSDYMAAVPDQIARWVPGGLHTLGTDGYGRSDTRAALRRHYEVDAESIAVAVLSALARAGTITSARAARAIEELGLDPEATWSHDR